MVFLVLNRIHILKERKLSAFYFTQSGIILPLNKLFFRVRIKAQHLCKTNILMHLHLRCDWRRLLQSTHFPSICRFTHIQCALCSRGGIILHFPALCAERANVSLALICAEWLPPTMISNGRDAKKMCAGKMNPLSRLGIAPNLCSA